MGMNIGNGGGSNSGSEPDVMIEMNMTPLIDVMLVLIIMLIITIPIQHHSVNLTFPANAAPTLTPPVVVEIDVGSDGAITWDGTKLVDRAALEGKLREAVAMPDQPIIRLHPNKDSMYAAVATVMASAQRLGASKVGLVEDD